MHEEMPLPCHQEMVGFQLWVNLPASLKMTTPRYQNIASDQIPEIIRDDGVSIRVIAGEVDGIRGPVSGIFADPTYMDVSIPANCSFSHSVARGDTVFAYVFEGQGMFDSGDLPKAETVAQPQIGAHLSRLLRHRGLQEHRGDPQPLDDIVEHGAQALFLLRVLCQFPRLFVAEVAIEQAHEAHHQFERLKKA